MVLLTIDLQWKKQWYYGKKLWNYGKNYGTIQKNYGTSIYE